MEVWGAAEATCDRWYAEGCRTLDDLRARPDLTEQQVCFAQSCSFMFCTTLSAPAPVP